jgi:hypothetical protein
LSIVLVVCINPQYFRNEFRWRGHEEIPTVVGLRINFNTLVKDIYKLGKWTRKK